MEQEPVRTVVQARLHRFRWVIRLSPILYLVLVEILDRAVGTGDAGIVNLTPRPFTISTHGLWGLAVLGAMGLAWAMVRTLPACFLLVARGDSGFPGPLPIVGSLSACLLCWSLWSFQGTLCAYVLLAGFVLTDGVLVASGIWSLARRRSGQRGYS